MMSKINMTEQLILECGYQEYKPSPLEHEGITKCWQKRFDDDVGKKYFINIHRCPGAAVGTGRSPPTLMPEPLCPQGIFSDPSVSHWGGGGV